MNNKFNIKKLVKISAVALAMISAGGVASTVNANTNVHADAESVEQREDASDNATVKQENAESKRDDAYAAYHAAKSDPAMLAYDVARSPEQIQGHQQELINDLTPSQRAIFKEHVAEDYGNEIPTSPKYRDLLKKDEEAGFFKAPARNSYIINHSSHNTESKMNTKTTVKHHVAKRAHLSKASVRRIMRQIRLDKKAIRNDKKQLSSRNGKKFTKSMNRSKRAIHIKGAKRYARYYKDEVKHEKDLVRLTKSTHASKATKRNARKSLKKVRKNHNYKNRKHAKRSHKLSHIRKQWP